MRADSDMFRAGGPRGEGLPAYVLITPARNEAAFIEQTIVSVCGQTVRPLRWIIVSDGSTDGTDAIVERYARLHDWIRLVRTPDRAGRHFAGKVRAFNTGHAALGSLAHDVIGNLDADITVDPGHFEFLMRRFAADPRLGVAGTPFQEGSQVYDYRYTNIEHVSGACQMFRRECFADIGGYQPAKAGGIDWVAVTTARMRGWRTQTFCDMVCRHHRAMGTAESSKLKARFRQGAKDYALGGHPLWQSFRSVYQMRFRPYGVGGMALMAGYLWALVTRRARTAGPELMRFHRREQLARLKSRLPMWPGRSTAHRP
jgi:poly-beta-1,6-N-acetyl-D-glucosamine synthase